MKKLNNQVDWKSIENKVSEWCHVDIIIDGYKITITLKPRSKTQLVYLVYVDGVLDLGMEEELQKKFWYKKTIRVHKRNAFQGVSRRTLKSMGIDPGRKAHYYTPFFKSFRSLKSVLKRNKSIRLISSDEEE